MHPALDLGVRSGLPGGMTYDPFTRGRFPVGVRTTDAVDTKRRRLLPTEVWYPATDAHAGQDLSDPTRDRFEVIAGMGAVTQDAVRDAAERPGSYPLVIFSHGFGGQRRQTTFLCTHLASHGYVVASPDHTGNTVAEVMQAIAAFQAGKAVPDTADTLSEFAEKRPADVEFVIDHLLAAGLPMISALIDFDAMGMSGHSFGGWTTLEVTARDRRIRAALPLAPAGGGTDLPATILETGLELNWGRDVPTLFLVAERDSLLPLAGMRDLFAKTRTSKRMVVLKNAEHMHFCDRVEQVHEMFRLMPPPGALAEIAKKVRPISELCPAENAYQYVRGLGLAHMDAVLRHDEAAARFVAGDLTATLRNRGIDVEVF